MADTPAVDYTSRDYEGFKTSLLDFAGRAFPQWVPSSEGDFGVLLIELFSYLGDNLSYYGDRLQQEAFLPTATQRLSLLQIADLLGYQPSNGVPATGTVTFQTSNPGPAVLVPAGTQVVTDYIDTIDSPITYETDTDVTVPKNGGTAVVSVTQGVTRTQVNVGTSNGLPVQEFRLPDVPVIGGTVKVYVDNVDSLTEWTYIDYLVDAEPADRVFTTYLDDAGSTWIRFGDNLNGAIPTVNLTVYATYRVGGGSVGNVNAGVVNAIASSTLPGVTIATNSDGTPITSAMSGGADPETNDQIRANAPRIFRTQDRCVTLADFSDLALTLPGIVRANAVASTYTSISVFVIGSDGGTPSATTLQSVQDTLQAKALAGTTVTVSGPTTVGVNVGNVSNPIVVECWPRYSRASVLYDVQQALKTMLSFANVDFGMRLTLSDFYKTILAVDGVRYVDIPMVARADAAQTGTADIVMRAWEIPKVGNISSITMTGGIG
ncbi:putative phage baseplate assembly protein [Streptomyces sp. BK022]|uniref:baseplate J/gp47 family protein n=1 Tax=Streptomyces sp. BK022 TaxID=2512123 RepID=UPI0010288133|nr:baseplate J/gp47 family protein [Streptomyces sp. BK022]RZU35942.1 putative phage baseplate assembly protein [Streptomyces sp. BK022]